MREVKSIVKAIRLTSKLYNHVKQEAEEEGKTISKMICLVLEQRYQKLMDNEAMISDPIRAEVEPDDRICYPLDNIEGKPLKSSNKVWLRGEIITYGELINKRYQRHRARIAKADWQGKPLDQIIKEIEEGET